jgi:hypothetical protein
MGAPLPRPPTQPLISRTQSTRITEVDPVTGVLFLVGSTIGVVAAIACIHRSRRIYQTQLAQYEAEIPGWINRGNRAVIGDYDEILIAIREAADFVLWQEELEKKNR